MAATSPKQQHLVVVLIVLLSAAAMVEAYPSRWHIHMVNGLSNGESLFVHCKSKDDDLGQHNLTAGEEFSWTFKVNFWGTTLFWCYLRKPNAEEASFDVFWVESRSVWLYYRCADGVCIWTAKDDGIYLKDIPMKRDVVVHKWDSPPK